MDADSVFVDWQIVNLLVAAAICKKSLKRQIGIMQIISSVPWHGASRSF